MTYMIYNKKLKAELNARGTVTFRAIPGLNQASELGEAFFPPEMIRKANLLSGVIYHSRTFTINAFRENHFQNTK